MGFSEDSLKHTQKKTLHAFKSLLQSSVTIRRDSLKLSSRKPNIFGAAYKLYQNAVPTFEDFGGSLRSSPHFPATCHRLFFPLKSLVVFKQTLSQFYCVEVVV